MEQENNTSLAMLNYKVFSGFLTPESFHQNQKPGPVNSDIPLLSWDVFLFVT